MENQQTQTLEGTAEVAPPVVSGTEETVTAPTVEVEATETVPTDTGLKLELTPVTGSVAVIVVGLLVLAVAKLRK
jgi:hypothetical protein